jgi:hypothetical protein
MSSSDRDPPACDAPGREGLRDGDVIKLGRYAAPSVNGGQPLVMEFEARVVTGPGAESLARGQAAAIREVLAWVASRQQSPDDEPGHDNAGPREPSSRAHPEATAYHQPPEPRN